MDYREKILKLDEHLASHPTDYQAVIARLKTISAAIDKERRDAVNMRLKRVAEYRRQFEEE